MDASFDPYRKWLGIRTRERPPNHYQLLGLELFEDDRETISHAADQRIAYVRTLAVNEYAELSQRVLNELAGAKVSLLSRDRKASYDARLRAELAGATMAAASPANAMRSANAPTPPADMADNRSQTPAPEAAGLAHIASARWHGRRAVICALCAALALPLAYSMVGFLRRPASTQISQAAPSESPAVSADSTVTSAVTPIQQPTATEDPTARDAMAPARSNDPMPPEPSAAAPESAGRGAKNAVNQEDGPAGDAPTTESPDNADLLAEPATTVSERAVKDTVVERPTSQQPLNTPAALKPKPLQPVKEYKGHQGPITSIAFGAGGKSFVTAGGGTFLVWNMGADEPTSTAYGRDRDIVVLSPQATHIAFASRNGGYVELYRASGGIIKSIRGVYTQVGFTADGDGVFCVKRDEVEGWSISTGEIVQKIMRFSDDPLKSNWCWCADLSKDGTRAITAGHGVISLWDLSKRKNSDRGEVGTHAIKHIKLPEDIGVSQISFVGDGQHVVTVSGDSRYVRRANGEVRFWNLQTGTEVGAGKKLPTAAGVVACPDAFRVFIVGTDGKLYIDDEMAGDATPATAADANPNCVAASPDGETLLTGDKDGVVSQWDVSELLAASANVDSKQAAAENMGRGGAGEEGAVAIDAPGGGGRTVGETPDGAMVDQPLPTSGPEYEYNGHSVGWWFDEYKKHYHCCYNFERDKRWYRTFPDKQAALASLQKERECASAIVAAAQSNPRVVQFYLETLASGMRQTEVADREFLDVLEQRSLGAWTHDIDIDRDERRHQSEGWDQLPDQVRRCYMAIFIARVGPSAMPTLIAALEKPRLRDAAIISLSLSGEKGLSNLLPLYSRDAAVQERRILVQAIDTVRRANENRDRGGGFFNFDKMPASGNSNDGGERSGLTAKTVVKLRGVLLDVTGDEDSPIAYAAAEMLVRWKVLPGDCGELAFPALKRLLRDPDAGIRRRAIAVLCELGLEFPPAFEQLARAVKEGWPVLSNDKHSLLIDSHNNANGEWRFLSRPEALPVLLALLEFPSDTGNLSRSQLNVLRISACRAVVGAYKAAPKPEIIHTLLILLADSAVRGSAAKSLGEIGPPAKDALPELRRLAEDREASDVERSFVKAALKRIAP